MKIKIQNGLGLLEILLVLIAISAVMILILRYAAPARQNLKIAQATDQINQIAKAGFEYLREPGATTKNISIDELVKGEYLAEKFETMQKDGNPWRQAITVQDTAGQFSGDSFTIAYAGVPGKACQELKAIFKEKARVLNGIDPYVDCTEDKNKPGYYSFSTAF